MSSGTPSLTILSDEQKFNGENLLTWMVNMTQLLASKGLLGYIDGKVTKPTEPTADAATPDSTPIFSTKPNFDEWTSLQCPGAGPGQGQTTFAGPLEGRAARGQADPGPTGPGQGRVRADPDPLSKKCLQSSSGKSCITN
jgi:hypothetical protein